MLILGIETSCDETACSIVKNGNEILSNAISSQINLHKKTGGVVPEVAAREHVVKIVPVLEEALTKATVKLNDIDAIAVTVGPGLLSSLIIGVNAAMTLSLIYKKPLIPVHHVEGHIYANWINTKPKFPIAVLTVSGGHNELILWKNHGQYKFLGATLDDAAGEAFDKVARLLGLSYPGGPAIEEAALKGDGTKFNLPRAWVTDFDFSFSGLKTAALRLVQSQKKITKQFVRDAAASFQESVCEVLASKLVAAAKKYKTREIHLAGGVSANKYLCSYVSNLLPEGVTFRYPTDFSLCTDNAAMIATAAYFKHKKNARAYKKLTPLNPDPNLLLKNWKF